MASTLNFTKNKYDFTMASAESQFKIIKNCLIRECDEAKSNTADLELRIQKAFDYFLEEIEIRIESMKIDLEVIRANLNRKTRILTKNFIKLNNEFNWLLGESVLLNDTSLYNIDAKLLMLYEVFSYFFKYLKRKKFKLSKALIDSQAIGTVPEQLFDPVVIPNEILTSINRGLF